MAKITITGLRKTKIYSFSAEDCEGGKHAVTDYETDVPPSWLPLTPERIAALRIKDLGYDAPTSLEADMAPAEVRVVSLDSPSCYNAAAEGGLCMREDETFATWWTKLNGGHDHPNVTSTFDSLSVYGTTVTFQRTLRVPDNGKTNFLPPGMGKFPLVAVAPHAQRLPEVVTSKGGYMIPMYQREALWLKFSHSRDACNAIKVSVGGINALTGAPKNEMGKPGVQDYLCKSQPWLDGIVKEEGKVKQFVAMPVGQGYTVEEQLTVKNSEATLQLDIFPAYRRDIEVQIKGEVLSDIMSTPLKAGLKAGDAFTVRPRSSSGSYSVRELLKLYRHLVFKAIYVEGAAPAGVVLFGSRPQNAGKGVELGGKPSSSTASAATVFGIAAGGSISQQINKDTQDISVYDFDAGRRIYIHLINACAWKDVTGLSAPITPVDKGAYKKNSIPWFNLYNEPESAKDLGAGFSTIQSVNQIDAEDDSALVERVDGPEQAEMTAWAADEALFAQRWKENDGMIIDIDAAEVSAAQSSGTIVSGPVRRDPPGWFGSHTSPRKSVPAASPWTFECDNVSRLTQ